MEKAPRPSLYLIDGFSFVFRAFYALPPLTNSQGKNVGAVLGFCNMLFKILKEKNPKYWSVVLDSGGKNFRHDLYPSYKAHRPRPPQDLLDQLPMIQEACEAFGVPTLRQPPEEADDLLASLAWQVWEDPLLEGRLPSVCLVSSDKDLMQLVSPGICLWDPVKGKYLNRESVVEKFGVSPEQVPHVQGLTGDASDNIPGVPGVGIKTAAQLIQQFHSLENLYQSLEEVPQVKRRSLLETHRDQAFLSKDLATLKKDLDLPCTLGDLRAQKVPESARKFLHRQGMVHLEKRMASLFEGPSPQPSEIKDNPPEGETSTLQGAPLGEFSWELFQSILSVPGESSLLESREAAENFSAKGREFGLIGWHGFERDGQWIWSWAVYSRDQVVEPAWAASDHPGFLSVFSHFLALSKSSGYKAVFFQGKELLREAEVWLSSKGLGGLSLSHSFEAMDDFGVMVYLLYGVQGSEILVELHKALPQEPESSGQWLKALLWAYPRWKYLLGFQKMSTLYEKIDRPALAVIEQMERNGIALDPDKIRQVANEMASHLKRLEGKIFQNCGLSFNVGSPKQLGEVLFENMGLPGGKKGKSGAYKTSSDVLEKLALAGHEVAQDLLDWRQLSKLQSTYTTPLLAHISPKSHRIHTTYHVTGTSTGRLSSSSPNLQNIPVRSPYGKKIRGAFCARPGHLLLRMDYSQVELRILSHMADIPSFKRAFAQGEDVHAIAAQELFPHEPMSPELRRRGKIINFGIIYGISGFGLAQQLNLPQSVAQHYIQRYKEKYPGITDYMEKAIQEAKEKGYVETLMGRKCWIPGIHDPRPVLRKGAERQAINAPIQGTSADLLKKAMVRMEALIKGHGWPFRWILQIHDEVVFEVPEDYDPPQAQALEEVMEGVYPLEVPLKVNRSVSPYWA